MKKQYKQSILDKEKRKDTSNAVRRHLADMEKDFKRKTATIA